MAGKGSQKTIHTGSKGDAPAAPVALPERATTAVADTVATEKPLTEFTWYTIAKGELGQREIKGAKHNPRIVEYHQTTTLKGSTDEIPWCSSFVNWCMAKAGYRGTRSAAARSWGEWGQRITSPIPGCIVVMTRKGGGHVGFYHGQDSYGLHILGGNQGDAVTVAKFDRSLVLAYVMPRNMWPPDNELFYREIARLA